MLGRRTMSNGNADATSATAKTNSPMARASGGKTSHRPAHEKARKSPSTVASAASAGHSRSHSRLPRARRSACASKNLADRSLARDRFTASSKSRSDSQGQENLPVKVPRTDPTGHARMDGSQPIRHPIESNQLVNFKARAYQRPFVALDQHFGYQGPRVVGTRLDGAIGACRHHGKQCTFRRFQHLPVDGEEIAALTHWPHHVGANAAPGRLFRYGPNLVVRVI